MPTDLYLIRHGQAFGNVSRVIAGMTGDQGLTDLGHEQVRRLADRLRADGFTADRLYASTLPRAQQTAAAVSAAIALPVQDDDELQEFRPGDADGLTYLEWTSTWPGLEHGPLSAPFHPMAANGESWASFVLRVGTELTRLVAAHPDERVVAVCHGGVVEASFYLAFGLSGSVNPVAFRTANSSITHWRYEYGERQTEHRHPSWTLGFFNDIRHLHDGR